MVEGWSKKQIMGLPVWWPLFVLGYIFVLFLASHHQLTIYPNTGDESSVLFQAQNFSQAKLGLEVKTSFPHALASHYTFLEQGEIYSEYPPLASLFLTPGVWTSWPLLMQALMATLGLTLLGRLLLQVGLNLQTSFLMPLFLAFAPSFFFHSTSYYTHIPQFLLTLVAFLAYLSFYQRSRLRDLFWLGLSIGLGALVRPYTAFILGLAFLPWCLALIFQKQRPGHFLLVGLGATVLGASGLFLWNFFLTGEFFDLVFFKAGENERSLGLNILLARGLEDHILQWHSFGKWLFGLGFSSLFNLFDGLKTWEHIGLFLFLGSFIGCFYFAKQAYHKGALLKFWGPAFSFLVLIVFMHLFYVSIGGRFGERYYFEAGFLFLLPYFLWLFNDDKRWKKLLFCGWLFYFGLLNYSSSVALKRLNMQLFAPYILTRQHLAQRAPSLVFLKSTPHHDPHFYAGPAPWDERIFFAVDPSHWAHELGPKWSASHRRQTARDLGFQNYYTYDFKERGPLMGTLKKSPTERP